ncbi:MAG: D-3-phosphoglycerate dehydrogenase, partial [uncultured Acetobacteraceae bacterium]
AGAEPTGHPRRLPGCGPRPRPVGATAGRAPDRGVPRHRLRPGCPGGAPPAFRCAGHHARTHALPARADRAPAEPPPARHDGHAEPLGGRGSLRGGGRHRLRHARLRQPHGGPHLGPHPVPRAPHPGAGARVARGALAGGARHRAGGQDPRRAGPRQPRRPRGAGRRRPRHALGRLEPQPDRRTRGRGRRHQGGQGRADGGGGRAHLAHRVVGPFPRDRRRGGHRAHEARRGHREHQPRAVDRPAGAGRGAQGRAHRRRGPRRVRPGAAAAGAPHPFGAEHRADAAPRLRHGGELPRLLPGRGGGDGGLSEGQPRARAPRGL